MSAAVSKPPPGDPKVVEEVVDKLKSQGLFDQFRKECLGDVDTKPAYQNLRQRVEGYVTRFLSKQVWSPSLNKNQLRDSLRRHINQSGMLTSGVERIIEQVVNPKIFQVIKPRIDEVICEHLGIDPKERQEQLQRKKFKQNLPPLMQTGQRNYNTTMLTYLPYQTDTQWQQQNQSQVTSFSLPNTSYPPPNPYTQPYPYGIHQQPYSYMQQNWSTSYPPLNLFSQQMAASVSLAASTTALPLNFDTSVPPPSQANTAAATVTLSNSTSVTTLPLSTDSTSVMDSLASSTALTQPSLVSEESSGADKTTEDRKAQSDDNASVVSSKESAELMPVTPKLEDIPLPPPSMPHKASPDSATREPKKEKGNNEHVSGKGASKEQKVKRKDLDDLEKLHGRNENDQSIVKRNSADEIEEQEEDTIESPKFRGTRSSSSSRPYKFAWDEGRANMSDVTVSSVHTSDLSSFEDEVSNGNESESEQRIKDESSDEEMRSSTMGVIWDGKNIEKDEDSKSQLSRAEQTQEFAYKKTHNPPKPRKLISLSYNYTDSEDDETREERKARIAREKEERYLRRQQRRAELEAKRKEREEEKAQQREEKRCEDEEEEEENLRQAEKIAWVGCSSDQKEKEAVECKDENKVKLVKRKKTKEQLKEQLREQKVLEKKRALHRQRTRNKRYTSEEFTSIFTEKKQPFSSQNYASITDSTQEFSVDISHEAIEIDTAAAQTIDLNAIEESGYPKSPPTPTQDEHDIYSTPATEVLISEQASIPIYKLGTTPPISSLSLGQIVHNTRSRSRLSDETKSNDTHSTGRAISPYSDISESSKAESTDSAPKEKKTKKKTDEKHVVSKVSAQQDSYPKKRHNTSFEGWQGDRHPPNHKPLESEPRHRSGQRYNIEDLYKPRISHRRAFSPPSVNQGTEDAERHHDSSQRYTSSDLYKSRSSFAGGTHHPSSSSPEHSDVTSPSERSQLRQKSRLDDDNLERKEKQRTLQIDSSPSRDRYRYEQRSSTYCTDRSRSRSKSPCVTYGESRYSATEKSSRHDSANLDGRGAKNRMRESFSRSLLSPALTPGESRESSSESTSRTHFSDSEGRHTTSPGRVTSPGKRNPGRSPSPTSSSRSVGGIRLKRQRSSPPHVESARGHRHSPSRRGVSTAVRDRRERRPQTQVPPHQLWRQNKLASSHRLQQPLRHQRPVSPPGRDNRKRRDRSPLVKRARR